MEFLRPFRSKYLMLLLALAVAADLFSTACSIKKPQAPSWMTTWELPLANRTYSVADIFDRMNSHNLVFDDSGNPGIQIMQILDTITVDQGLNLAGADLHLMDSLGIMEIAPPDDIQGITNLSDIIEINLGFVPPASFEISQPIDRFDNFSWAYVEHGLMNLTFRNTLEVDLDTFIVTVIDSSDMHVIGILTYQNGLSYLETETQQLDLSNQTISNSIFMRFHGHTPGGILIYAGVQRLESTVSFPENITVSAARARVSEFIRIQRGSYEIDDSTRIYAAVIYSGVLNMHISNNTDLPFDVTLRSPNFRQNGSDLTLNHVLQPHNYSEVTLDLAGFEFTPDDSSQGQFVTVDMVNTVQASGQQQYTFRSSDSLSLDVNVSEILFETLTGRIKPATVTITPITRDMNLPVGMNRARLNRASLCVTIRNNSMIPAFADIIVNGNDKDVHFRGLVSGKNGPNDPPAITILDAEREELSRFLDPPPENMLITGQGIINPNYDVVSIRRHDSFGGDITFRTALAFIIGDTIEIDPIIARIPLDSRPSDFGRTFGYGAFEARLVNHLPVGVEIAFFIGHASDSMLFKNPETIILGPYLLEAALTDSNGYVYQAVSSDISDSLGSRALELLREDSLFFGERVGLLPTPPSGVVITGDDNIRVGAKARIEMLIGGN